MKIRPVGAQLLHAVGRVDGQTDMKKLIVAFRSFANAPQNDQFLCGVQVGKCLGTHMRRNVDNTSTAQYVVSNACEYEYARRTRGNTI
jgi:hypothetical protein